MYSWVVRPVPLTRETDSFSPHTIEPWWWCIDSYEWYDSSTMNIHYGNHGNETSRKAVLSIHECHQGDLDIFSPLWENWPQMGVCQFVRVVQVVDSWIVITETMETLCIICFCGNHSNLFDALVMTRVFTDYVFSWGSCIPFYQRLR